MIFGGCDAYQNPRRIVRAPDTGGTGSQHKRAQSEIYIPKLEGMQKRLATLFANKKALTGGRLQMIGLQEVRDRLGGKWHRLEAAVHALTEEILKQNMGDEDLFLRYGKDKYLIIFASKTEEAAEITAATIASTIREQLFSDERTDVLKDKLTVETTIVTLDPDKLEDKDNPLADLDYAVDRKRAADRNSRRTQLEDGLDSSSYHRGQSMHMVYMPMWDARRMAMTAYLGLLTDSVVQDDNTLTNYRQICEGRAAGELATLDLLILQQAQDEAQAMVRDGRKFLMVCPVHIDTLSIAATYSQYMSISSEFPPQMKKFLIFNLMGVHEGIDKHAVRNHVKALRAVGRNVWCMARMNDFNPKLYKEAGVDAVGFFIPRQVDERKLLLWMDDVSFKMKTAGMRGFLLDVPSLSVATSAVCAGFSMIGGSVVHDYVDRPANAARFQYEDLFSDLLGSDTADS